VADAVQIKREGAVLTLVINRAERRNALNEAVAAGLIAGLDAAEADGGVRVVVLTGVGDDAFCAGGDMKPAADGTPFTIEPADPHHYVVALLKRMDACRLPLIARVNGDALAGGLGLACACDLVVALDGYRASTTMMIAGREAVEKANAVGRAVLGRASRLIRQAGFADFSETSVEILGAETTYGGTSRATGAREVVLKIAVRHSSADALKIFSREIFPAGTAMAQGLTGFSGGRPEPQPVVCLFSFQIDKAEVPVWVRFGDNERELAPKVAVATPKARPARTDEAPTLSNDPVVLVPLIAVAHGRSGDKGDAANIGVIGRRREFVPALHQGLTAEAVRDYFAHYVLGPVERFDWPGLNGFNFLLHRALRGRGVASLRHDPQGKALAQALMDFPLGVPAAWLEPGGLLERWTETSRAGMDT
jgi:Enoyl-CoA hydratase/isomerase